MIFGGPIEQHIDQNFRGPPRISLYYTYYAFFFLEILSKFTITVEKIIPSKKQYTSPPIFGRHSGPHPPFQIFSAFSKIAQPLKNYMYALVPEF